MRRKPEAVCTAALIIINIAVFLVMSMIGNMEEAVFMLQHGAVYEPLVIEEHEFYRIFTSIFLHFGISHLMNNMVMLGALGWNLELEIGKGRFLIIYLLSGIGGNLLSLYHSVSVEEYAVSAGASGAVFGLMGALLYVVIANGGRLGRLSGRGLLIMAALSFYFGLTSSGVDNWAHIGGLLSGFFLAFVLYRKTNARRDANSSYMGYGM